MEIEYKMVNSSSEYRGTKEDVVIFAGKYETIYKKHDGSYYSEKVVRIKKQKKPKFFVRRESESSKENYFYENDNIWE